MHKLKNVTQGRAEIWDGKKLGTVIRLGVDTQGRDWYSYDGNGELLSTLAAGSRSAAIAAVLYANGYRDALPPTGLASQLR